MFPYCHDRKSESQVHYFSSLSLREDRATVWVGTARRQEALLGDRQWKTSVLLSKPGGCEVEGTAPPMFKGANKSLCLHRTRTHLLAFCETQWASHVHSNTFSVHSDSFWDFSFHSRHHSLKFTLLLSIKVYHFMGEDLLLKKCLTSKTCFSYIDTLYFKTEILNHLHLCYKTGQPLNLHLRFIYHQGLYEMVNFLTWGQSWRKQ